MSTTSQGHESDTSFTSDKPGAADILEMVEDTIREVPGGSKTRFFFSITYNAHEVSTSYEIYDHQS